MLLSFVSNQCAYVLCNVSTVSPKRLAMSKSENPAPAMLLIRNDACECRYGIITTNGKSLYFQGVHAFAVIYSIPFPS